MECLSSTTSNFCYKTFSHCFSQTLHFVTASGGKKCQNQIICELSAVDTMLIAFVFWWVFFCTKLQTFLKKKNNRKTTNTHTRKNVCALNCSWQTVVWLFWTCERKLHYVFWSPPHFHLSYFLFSITVCHVM